MIYFHIIFTIMHKNKGKRRRNKRQGGRNEERGFGHL